MSNRNKIAVLVMAYGGPATLDEIPGYLADIRAGRTTSKVIIDEIRGNYEAIGGGSPLLKITMAQVEALQKRFEPDECSFFVGMRHWAPWIEDAVIKIVDEGFERAVSLVLAPHFSKESIAKYQGRIKQGEKMAHAELRWSHISQYFDEPALIRALSQRISEGSRGLKPGDYHVLFSAHSLPSRILKEGDPYQDQLFATAALVAKESGLSDSQWSWAYQSAGRTHEPWLGPTFEEGLETLAKAGKKTIISVPVGFVSDHVEILFDIDIKGQQLANKLGLNLIRPPALNDSPLYIDALESVVRKAFKALT